MKEGWGEVEGATALLRSCFGALKKGNSVYHT